jgi:hypothetical protein
MIGWASLSMVKNQHRHVLNTTSFTGMESVRESRYNLGILTRSVSSTLENAVETLMQTSFKGSDRVLQQQQNWYEIITIMIGAESSSNLILLEPLVNDIVMCCETFTQIAKANTIRLSLKVVNHDACRKFHIDGYTYRLLCTYYGPGTEWVYNDNVNRKYLGEGENEDIIKDGMAIQRIDTYDIAILKGELPHQRNGKGIVHRSPPIQHTTDKRLVLRIDYTS